MARTNRWGKHESKGISSTCHMNISSTCHMRQMKHMKHMSHTKGMIHTKDTSTICWIAV